MQKKMRMKIVPNFVNFPLSTKLDFKDASKENKSPSFKDNKSITDGGWFLLALEVNRVLLFLQKVYVVTVMCVRVREASLYHFVCF